MSARQSYYERASHAQSFLLSSDNSRIRLLPDGNPCRAICDLSAPESKPDDHGISAPEADPSNLSYRRLRVLNQWTLGSWTEAGSGAVPRQRVSRLSSDTKTDHGRRPGREALRSQTAHQRDLDDARDTGMPRRSTCTETLSGSPIHLNARPPARSHNPLRRSPALTQAGSWWMPTVLF